MLKFCDPTSRSRCFDCRVEINIKKQKTEQCSLSPADCDVKRLRYCLKRVQQNNERVFFSCHVNRMYSINHLITCPCSSVILIIGWGLRHMIDLRNSRDNAPFLMDVGTINCPIHNKWHHWGRVFRFVVGQANIDPPLSRAFVTAALTGWFLLIYVDHTVVWHIILRCTFLPDCDVTCAVCTTKDWNRKRN